MDRLSPWDWVFVGWVQKRFTVNRESQTERRSPMRTKVPNLHILLSLTQLSDKERVDFAKHIAELAPASSLYSNPHIQAAVGQVSTLGTKLGTNDSGVGGLEA